MTTSELLARWEARALDALPTDAMLINLHARELREVLSTAARGTAQAAPIKLNEELVTILGRPNVTAAICRAVAELPDRNSPADWPEAMLVTHAELTAIVTDALAATQARPAVLAELSTHAMATEYERWIGFFHRGDGDYNDFLRIEIDHGDGLNITAQKGDV